MFYFEALASVCYKNRTVVKFAGVNITVEAGIAH
jgi:hypothetical protein